jgi:hypothetical protein
MQKPARSKGIFSSLPIRNPQSTIQNPNSSPPYEGGVAALRGRGGSLFVRPDITFVSKKIAIFICSPEIVQFGLSNLLHYSLTV